MQSHWWWRQVKLNLDNLAYVQLPLNGACGDGATRSPLPCLHQHCRCGYCFSLVAVTWMVGELNLVMWPRAVPIVRTSTTFLYLSLSLFLPLSLSLSSPFLWYHCFVNIMNRHYYLRVLADYHIKWCSYHPQARFACRAELPSRYLSTH